MVIDTEILLRLFIAVVVGGIIGYERRKVHKPAGLRTHMLVCLGASLFTVVGITAFSSADPSRVVAGIVTGIGFLGAGTIFRAKDTVKGLTTAASLWAVAAIGITVGLGEYVIMTTATVLVILILQLNKIEYFREI
jgi:putative Mg2+ transporter-C (MgtC) family protein|tara:strand:+ start:261 stop:668 length:408 start_codon:yes stop_codon:yes gene_type:complete